MDVIQLIFLKSMPLSALKKEIKAVKSFQSGSKELKRAQRRRAVILTFVTRQVLTMKYILVSSGLVL